MPRTFMIPGGRYSLSPQQKLRFLSDDLNSAIEKINARVVNINNIQALQPEFQGFKDQLIEISRDLNTAELRLCIKKYKVYYKLLIKTLVKYETLSQLEFNGRVAANDKIFLKVVPYDNIFNIGPVLLLFLTYREMAKLRRVCKTWNNKLGNQVVKEVFILSLKFALLLKISDRKPMPKINDIGIATKMASAGVGKLWPGYALTYTDKYLKVADEMKNKTNQ